jgi:hypothetical protein
MARKQILLNAFYMNCVGHINHGLWMHPRDRSVDYRQLPYSANLARTLERGLYKTAYADGTLRHRLFGDGDQLPERHAAAGFRRRATGPTNIDTTGAAQRIAKEHS